jgi:hypothetical protein
MTAAVAAACFGIVASAVDSAFAQDARKNTGVVSGDCVTTAQKFLVATKPITVNGNSQFVALPESVSFVQGSAGCVIVSFSAEARVALTGNLQVRPTLDGNPGSIPQIANLAAGSNVGGYEAHAMNFVFTNVPRGRHVLKMEFSPSYWVYLQTRSTVVNYVK